MNFQNCSQSYILNPEVVTLKNAHKIMQIVKHEKVDYLALNHKYQKITSQMCNYRITIVPRY